MAVSSVQKALHRIFQDLLRALNVLQESMDEGHIMHVEIAAQANSKRFPELLTALSAPLALLQTCLVHRAASSVLQENLHIKQDHRTAKTASQDSIAPQKTPTTHHHA